jgi:hypothetical protein
MRIDNNMAGVGYLDSKRRRRKKSLSIPDPSSGIMANFSGASNEVGMGNEKREKKDNPQENVHRRANLEKIAHALVNRGAI